MGSNHSVTLKHKQSIKLTFFDCHKKTYRPFSAPKKKKLLSCIQKTANAWYHVSTNENQSLYYAKLHLMKIVVTRERIEVMGTLTLDKNKVGNSVATQEGYIKSLQSIHWLDHPCYDDKTFEGLHLVVPKVEFM